MFFQMKFKFSKKIQTVHDFTQNLCFFLTGLLCFSSKSLYPESMTAAMFTLPKMKRSTWMLIGLPDFSCVKIFTFQCFKSVTPFVVQ